MSEPTAFQRILVAVRDGSCADQLLAAAIRLASGREAQFLLVYVSDTNVCCGAMDHPALHEHERDLLRSLVEGLSARSIRARSELRVTTSGRIAEHLLDATAEWRADLLVTAAGRRGRFRDRPWRRVLQRLLRGAPCPVLLLPRERSMASTSPASDALAGLRT